MTRRCLAISAVNFTEGGPLTVLQDFVAAACEVLPPEWEIVAFVHDRRLLTSSRVRSIEIPYTKHSWLRRLRFEWRELRTYSQELRPDLWVSLHDISPNVGNVRQVVYCHNPVPFFRMRIQDAFFEPTMFLFWIAYGALYRRNIEKNFAVVVQQSWLRAEFAKWTKRGTKIIVAHPSIPAPATQYQARPHVAGRAVFLYPALPRAFKNIELIGRAVEELEREDGWHSEVVLTIDGSENRYAKWLLSKFGKLKTIRFAGRQSREQMRQHYAKADCLLFPSRLETWGLPITEAKQHGLPMFVADSAYARETVGNYDMVEFVDIDDHLALSRKLLLFQTGAFPFRPARCDVPAPPFAPDWASLIGSLTEDLC